ncbi:MAG: type II secretion system protein GspG [Candidatus Levybacteria bacterium]|nr:type II secretion system protein GspG [Candidatus Levybacteria bacterium]
MGILVLFAIKVFDPVNMFKKLNDDTRKSDLTRMQSVLERYYKSHGRYPKNSNISPLYRIVRLDGTIADWGQQWIPYMDILPKDPALENNYVYFSVSNGQAYYLYASLNIGGKDAKTCKKNSSVCDSVLVNGIPGSACGGICNYAVSSLNVSP